MHSEVADRTDFSIVRYAQAWEDADVLLEALDVQPGDTCLSIASAGDNTLALLTRNPAKVVALDLSGAQLACLELRVAGYRMLSHSELLDLIGSRPSARRRELYARCRPALSHRSRAFWDERTSAIDRGIGSAGKLERYFDLFRRFVLPLVHGQATVRELLRPKPFHERVQFYDRRWDTWRWRLLFRLFFSRAVMSRLGRDPGLFRYVDGPFAETVLERTRHALTVLDPSENPYGHWILTGTHGAALPCALRPEHFDTIRNNLDRLEWRRTSLEEFLSNELSHGDRARQFDKFNLSNIFEYVSQANHERMLSALVRCSRPGARLAYWNLRVDRKRPEHLARRLRSLDGLADALHASDRAFFYTAFRVEEVL